MSQALARVPQKRIEDWFEDGEDFERMLKLAIRETESPQGLDFLADLEDSWKAYGMRTCMSYKVYRYLVILAGETPDPSE